MPIRVAVAGTGMIADVAHIPAWKALGERAEIVGVFNRRRSRAEAVAAKHRVPRVYDDLASMLVDARPDVVSVCTPNVSHAPIVRACLEAGAHVVCEKPLTTTRADAAELYRLAETSSLQLVPAQTLRFAPEIEAAHRIASTGMLGEVYYAEAAALRRRGVPTWGTFHVAAESGGGPLFDLGVHALDAMLWIMGNPRIVSASGATYRKLAHRDEGLVTSLASSGAPAGVDDPRPFDPSDFDVEDLGSGFLRFENGATMVLRASWAANIPDGFARPVIVGTDAGMTLNPLSIVGRTGAYQSDTVPVVPDAPDIPFHGHHKLMQHVAALIEGDEQQIVHPAEVLNVLGALEALYASAVRGEEVRVEAE